MKRLVLLSLACALLLASLTGCTTLSPGGCPGGSCGTSTSCPGGSCHAP